MVNQLTWLEWRQGRRRRKWASSSFSSSRANLGGWAQCHRRHCCPFPCPRLRRTETWGRAQTGDSRLKYKMPNHLACKRHNQSNRKFTMSCKIEWFDAISTGKNVKTFPLLLVFEWMVVWQMQWSLTVWGQKVPGTQKSAKFLANFEHLPWSVNQQEVTTS